MSCSVLEQQQQQVDNSKLTSTITQTTISSLYCYPIKSCKGIQLEQAWVGKTGIIFDRHWMLIDEKGNFVTQRKYPKMALVSTSIPCEIFSGEWGQIPEDTMLTISAPDHGFLNIPLIKQDDVTTRIARIWDWQGPTIDEGDDAAEWFSSFLGSETRLVRFAANAQDLQNVENVFARPADSQFAAGYEVHFSDGFPILLTSTGSLDSLNEEGGMNMPMDRFRANIVVNNCLGFEEDKWEQGESTEGIKFNFVKPCFRCKATTVDQAKGEIFNKEPLKTLAVIRKGSILGWSDNQEFKEFKNLLFFGWNLVVLNYGILRVGETINMKHRLQKFAS